MTGFIIAGLVAVNAVMWTEIITRGPTRKPGVFEEHPMVGVAVVCAGAVIGMWIHGSLA